MRGASSPDPSYGEVHAEAAGGGVVVMRGALALIIIQATGRCMLRLQECHAEVLLGMQRGMQLGMQLGMRLGIRLGMQWAPRPML